MTKQEQKARFAQALAEAHKYGPWTLQQRDSYGEWKNIGSSIWGRDTALEKLQEAIKSQGGDWRALPKNEADKYREGIKQGKELGGSIPQGMYLPDRI
jgi:hypothetical protein